jgi:protein SCO1/2
MSKYIHPLLAGLALMTLASAYIISKDLDRRSTMEELAFPAESIRTQDPAPTIALTNHLGEPYNLETTRGDVVMITAVYATCPHTCPAIIRQAKKVSEELDPNLRRDFRVLGITMDPENDSPEALAELAEMHGLEAPLFQFLTGDPEEVNSLLDDLGFARQFNPETGEIDHVNLCVLIDRDGKIAYRLTLGEKQELWLQSALTVLLEEDYKEFEEF